MRQSRFVCGYGSEAVFDRCGCDEEEMLCKVEAVVVLAPVSSSVKV